MDKDLQKERIYPINELRQQLIDYGYVPNSKAYSGSPSRRTLKRYGYGFAEAVELAGFDYILSIEEGKLVDKSELVVNRKRKKKKYATETQDSNVHPKTQIANAIKNELSNNPKFSLKELHQDAETGYQQIYKIFDEENYTIDTLLMILDTLNLEIIIKKKSE